MATKRTSKSSVTDNVAFVEAMLKKAKEREESPKPQSSTGNLNMEEVEQLANDIRSSYKSKSKSNQRKKEKE